VTPHKSDLRCRHYRYNPAAAAPTAACRQARAPSRAGRVGRPSGLPVLQRAGLLPPPSGPPPSR